MVYLINDAEIFKEPFRLIKQKIVFRHHDDVGDVPRLRERLDGERVPVVEREGGEGHEVLFVPDCDRRDGQGLALVIGVALGGGSGHLVSALINFLSLSLTKRQNKLECLSVASFFKLL
jgi:hypothetical protein